MRGVNILLNKQVEKITKHKDDKKIFLKKSNIKITANEVLVAIGRSANIENLNLDKIGVKLTNKNAIKVNKNLMTNKKIFLLLEM